MSEELQDSANKSGFVAVATTDNIELGGTSQTTDPSVLVPASDVSKDPSKKLEFPIDYIYLYLNKLKGPCNKSPDRSHIYEMIYTSILGFIGIFINSVIGFWYLGRDFTVENGTIMTYMSGAYAATSVLVYDAKLIYVPVAQPRNVIGGYIVASFIGVVTRIICGYIGLERWTTAAFAVMFALFFMSITKTLHPPAGAVALISVIGGPGVWDLGFAYVLTSAGGSFIMVAVALLGNNLVPTRQYPSYWW